MEDKYNQLHLQRYSKELANLLCDRHFTLHDALNGPQLIGFAPIKQVNLFVIKELLLKWHAEMANLRSPYFDFQNEEVKEALLHFMNVLSRKILMKRPAFEPLLQKAVYDTFLVSLAPVATFEEKFLRIQEEISLPKLQENIKYIDVDKPLFAGFIDTLTAPEQDRDHILKSFKQYVAAHDEQRRPLQELMEQFNKLLPISISDLTGTPAPAVTARPTPAAPEEEKDVVAPIHTAQREASVPDVAPKRQPLVRAHDPEEEEGTGTARPTLNDNFRKAGTSTSLADTHSNQRIDSLKNSISINQRFSFINELFEGDNLTYYQAIQALDVMTSEAQARQYIQEQLASKYDWSKKQEHVNKLYRLIERKFSA